MSDVGANALIPNPRLQPLRFLVGEWRATATHPMLEGSFDGTTTFAWSDGGAFLVMRSHFDQPDVPDGVAYLGSDDKAGTFTLIYFDEREVSRVYEVEVGDGTVTWRRDDPELAQSMTFTRQDDGTIVSQGRMSQNRGPWGDDLSAYYSRVH